MFCPHCGARISSDAQRCPNCRQILHNEYFRDRRMEQYRQQERRDKTALLLLSLVALICVVISAVLLITIRKSDDQDTAEGGSTEKCLESYSEPLSDWSVSCIMCDLVHFMKADPDREIIKKGMAHCSGGRAGRYHGGGRRAPSGGDGIS